MKARCVCLVVLIVGVWTVPRSPVHGQEPENLILTAADRWPIHISYYNAPAGRRSREWPVVVLITAANGSGDSLTRRVWDDLARHLVTNRFAVVSVDLRKHGDSLLEDGKSRKRNRVRNADYQDMVLLDMEAVKKFLLERHEAQELNIRKTGLVASGASGLVAAAFALNDWNRPPWPDAPTPAERTPRGQDVRAIVMISPRMTPGFSAAGILKPLARPEWKVAFRIYHSSREQSREEARTARRLYRLVDLRGEEYDDLRSIVARPASAEQFLNGPTGTVFRQDLTAWLRRNLDELQDPWRSRVSPLQR